MRQSAGDDRRIPADELWRAWLMTGVRRVAGDRRRIRGAHVGLKRMLVEGMHVSSEKPYTWKDFSDSMVRQAVGEAIHAMPARDAELIKLAYFGGLSNQELATRVRLTEAAVERRLRRALDAVSEHVRRGRGLGHKILATVALWCSGRWLSDNAPQVVPAGVVTAALLVVAQPGFAGGASAAAAPGATTAPAYAVFAPMPGRVAPARESVSSTAGSPANAAATGVSTPELPSVSMPAVTLAPSVGVPSLPAVPPVRVPRVTTPIIHRVTSITTSVKSGL